MKGFLHSAASLLSCKQYSELASRKLDEPLGLWDSIRHRFHHVLCMVCRRYSRQIETIHKAASSYCDSCHEHTPHEEHLGAEAQLSDEATRALQNKIQAELKF